MLYNPDSSWRLRAGLHQTTVLLRGVCLGSFFRQESGHSLTLAAL
jgi:hypothetical protein